jgi:AcrR family transcriptional regulator
MDTPTWRAIHIYYYAADKDDLILNAVRPLLERLTGQVERAYFVRHWRRGPHLRIPVLATPDAFRSVVEPAVAEVVGAYLAMHPSTASLPREDVLLPIHELLAELELEAGPLRPLVRDNSILFQEHDRRLHVLDGEAGSDLLADYYSATNELAFCMLEEIKAGVNREALGLALMLAVAHSYFGAPPTIQRGFVSFRSHAEAFLYTCSDPDGIRASFERQYQANRPALTRLVRRVLATLDGSADEIPFVSQWVAAVRPFWVRSEPLISSGQLTLSAIGQPTEGRRSRSVPGGSTIHRMMFDSPAFRSRILDDPQFKRYRLVLNYTYLHMARLGITGYARYRLCHLAANAVEDTLGVNAMEAVKSFVERFPD